MPHVLRPKEVKYFLALRHKLELSIVYLELKSLSDISINHGNKAATQAVYEVGKRIQKHLRDEELAARIDVSRFALLLAAANGSNSKIAIRRVQSMIKSMAFVVNNPKIRVDIAAGIFSIDLKDKEPGFNELCMRADTALQKAANGESGNILSYYDEASTDTDNEVPYDYFLTKSLPCIS